LKRFEIIEAIKENSLRELKAISSKKSPFRTASSNGNIVGTRVFIGVETILKEIKTSSL